MAHLFWYQYVLIGLVFIWSGFVRSGLGFGGAVLALPFLLLIENQPLVYLPLIAVHLMIFSSLTVLGNQGYRQFLGNGEQSTVDWSYLGKSLLIMIIPKLIGVFGLITLPPVLMGGIIFSIVSAYALSYILNKPFKSSNPKLDILFLMLGGYISGTSLIGAPLIVAVYSTKVAPEKLRNTLFALWFILVTIKMAAFIMAGVDLQLIHHLWLLPCAAIGHVLGLRFHDRMMHKDQVAFFRMLGFALLLTSSVGLWNSLM
ncbi:permease [Hahella sp. CCB-MM4]|uniref:sulfite exporter TauE/SafE family protein n=1 Tax=Hahella sp. (strain CCB-MM4) TaxID=1926491 RepID=UPI000B9A5544|nr:sulfite exporter TauE/SafE family protein [Hahella sp. CCB-MM4]OZG71880.1 permease [Hahella sp. CCB-MM4]